MNTEFSYRIAEDHVVLQGDLVFGAHPKWRNLLRDLGAPSPGERILLEMSRVSDLDAAGLGLLMITNDALKAKNARLILSGAVGDVRRVLDVSGFAGLIDLE